MVLHAIFKNIQFNQRHSTTSHVTVMWCWLNVSNNKYGGRCLLTELQVKYAEYLENVRTHRATEANAARQAAAAESQAATARRNAEIAQQNADTARKNAILQESAIGAQWAAVEADRAYKEAMAYVEKVRADNQYTYNMLQIDELVRHNVESEWLQQTQILTNARNVKDTNSTNLEIAQGHDAKDRQVAKWNNWTALGTSVGKNTTDIINNTVGTAGSVVNQGIGSVGNLASSIVNAAGRILGGITNAYARQNRR